ncbi:transcription factor 25 [Abrus precatorius]|uniref:Transcription factor 25 n=1 Tax=Abrus precatorius TaxID=3816 RepID=A0A8B8JVK4_ABRPR|nr:transcription factor 25 [Abrus precatorius]
MSARLMKKVLNEQQHLPQHVSEEEEEHDDQLNPEDEDSITRSSINPFDLLNDHDSEPEHQGDELTYADEALVRYDDKEVSSSLKHTAEVSTSNSKSKKKKKKKNKDSAVANKTRGEEELDSILEDLSLNVNSSSEQPVSSKANVADAKDNSKSFKQHAASVLQVDPKYLNAENELRRIFGSKVVKSFENSNQASSSRQMRGVRRGHYNLKKTVLVTPSDNWLRFDGSLSMEFLESKNGYNYFRYIHSPSYTQHQKAFEAAKAINNINGIAVVLQHCPYHLDSLLTMAEYFAVLGEQQMSADAIGRCLYALECAWHPMFTPLQGNCQLKFRHDSNKPIFTALFTHMKNLDRRGCHRSALEVCKLLLSLDSDDPMGAIFCIDYFALRAEEYAWLEKFSEDYKSDNSIWLFPNFSYSLAICRFYLECDASKDACIDAKKASSSELMKQALMLHPSVIKRLVAKVPLKDRTWTDILKHAFFRSDQTGIPSQDHLINIYVERNYLLWRLPDLQKLLSGAAKLVIETLESNQSELKDWACVRKEAFSSEKNEYGHLLVSDFSDSVSSIPRENLQQFMGVPGIREGMQDENQFANQQGNGHAPRGVANRNALAVLFESMLPWVTYEDREDGEPDDNQLDDHRQDNQ